MLQLRTHNVIKMLVTSCRMELKSVATFWFHRQNTVDWNSIFNKKCFQCGLRLFKLQKHFLVKYKLSIIYLCSDIPRHVSCVLTHKNVKGHNIICIYASPALDKLLETHTFKNLCVPGTHYIENLGTSLPMR